MAPDAQTTLSNGSSAISLSSPSPIKHKPQYPSQANVSYESEGACVSCCVAFFYLIGMLLIVLGIGATAMITQYPEHVLYLAMAGASGIILGLIFVSLSATMCRPRRRRVVDAKSDVNGNAGNQQNGKTRALSNGLPSTNRYEVRAGGSADVIDDNLVLSSSPKIHQTTAGAYHTDGGPTGRSNHSSQQTNKPMAPIQLKFVGGPKPGPPTISDYTISAHHPYGTLPPAYMTLNGHMSHHHHQYPADISAHSLVNNYSIDTGAGVIMNMMGPSHPSEEALIHSSLKNGHSTATLPLPAKVRSSVSYNDILLEEPRRVGIHILRQREASSSEGLDSNGSDEAATPMNHCRLGSQVPMGAMSQQMAGHSQSPTPPSDCSGEQQVKPMGSAGHYSQKGGRNLAPVREVQTHHSTSSDDRSSPRSDYYSKESSIASTERQMVIQTSQSAAQPLSNINTVGLPQASPRKKPPEVAPKPFMIPNVAGMRPVLPQIVQPSFYSTMSHTYQSSQQDTSYASIDHGMVHPANVVALNPDDDPSRNDLLETQI